MMRTICSAVVMAALMGSTAMLAQDTMSKPGAMGPEKSYTGCIAAGASKGTFSLTHAMIESAMAKDAMGKDAMAKDAMAKDAMAKDAMGKSAMDMSTLSISSKKVDLAKHVGHKVMVTGTEDSMGKGMHAFLVTTLKMVAGSCGS